MKKLITFLKLFITFLLSMIGLNFILYKFGIISLSDEMLFRIFISLIGGTLGLVFMTLIRSRDDTRKK